MSFPNDPSYPVSLLQPTSTTSPTSKSLTRIGGNPSFFAPLHSLPPPLLCLKCAPSPLSSSDNTTSPLFQLLQIHCPITTHPSRLLSIFQCKTCGDVRCVRSQLEVEDTPSPLDATAVAEIDVKAKVNAMPKEIWGDDDGGWGDDSAGGWGDDVNEASLEALVVSSLSQGLDDDEDDEEEDDCITIIATATTSTKKTTKSKKPKPNTISINLPQQLNTSNLETFDEPLSISKAMKSSKKTSSKSSSSAYADDEKVRQMILRYTQKGVKTSDKDESDIDSDDDVKKLIMSSIGNFPGNDSSDDENDDNDSTAPLIASPSDDEDEDEDLSNSNVNHIVTKTNNNKTESYEKLPLPTRYLLHFQEIISRAPRQIVRYAYGGEVLWSLPGRIEKVVKVKEKENDHGGGGGKKKGKNEYKMEKKIKKKEKRLRGNKAMEVVDDDVKSDHDHNESNESEVQGSKQHDENEEASASESVDIRSTHRPIAQKSLTHFMLPPAIPNCPYCKGPRSFEFQVMPSLKYFIDENEKATTSSPSSSSSSLCVDNWGVIAVYVCAESCRFRDGNNGMVVAEEFVVVQPNVD